MYRVSIKDVAKHAGVSTATVSHVINKTKNVSEGTRKRVLDSIQELNFRPNYVARSFKTGHSKLIAFVVPDIANNFYATLTEEIQHIIGSEGYQILLVNTGENIEDELEMLQALEHSMVDAIILATTLPDYSSLKKVISGNIPYLFVDRKLDFAPFDSVTVSSYDAICTALERLITLGHKKIGYINGLERLSSTQERFRAYKDTMVKHEIFDPEIVQTGGILRLTSSTNPLSLVKQGCSAIVCANNVLTIDTFNRVVNAGIIPGRDVELIGFRESNATQYELQFLDLIIRPASLLGQMAGKQIMMRLQNPELPFKEIILQAQFHPKEKVPQLLY